MATQSFQELGIRLHSLKAKHPQKLIAIDGGGGAGKSTFAKKLSEHLPNSFVIHIDDFYIGPWNYRLDHADYNVNPLFDWDRFEREVLESIKHGHPIRYHIYDWIKHTTDTVASVMPDATVIVEGGFSTQDRFAKIYDFTIWIEAEVDVRLERALKRDGEHMRALWEEDWIPVEKNYVRAQNPAARADLIVQGHSQDFSKGTFEVITHHQ